MVLISCNCSRSVRFDPNHKWHAESVFCHGLWQMHLSLNNRWRHRELDTLPCKLWLIFIEHKWEGLTRRQCLITAATSSWMRSFFAMPSTCCRVSGWGRGLLSLTPARDSLGEVSSWKGRPRSFSKELKSVIYFHCYFKSYGALFYNTPMIVIQAHMKTSQTMSQHWNMS